MLPHLQNGSETLNPGPDLTDPTVLAQLLREDAECLKVQANANGLRASALGGHPCPEFFYRAVAVHLEAAAAQLSPKVEPPAPAGAAPRRTIVDSSPEALANSLPQAWEPGGAAPTGDRKKK